ncbi:hypothetical protein GCM10009837_63830 [Streptomyces durmitorensis]|uniref:MarR family transcriptional regulator n=1 Tax=Streptomyces durmitorensis TaxID=319947 RepID=A0ABY4PVS6_9ACTN|nr:hypothetical protein [Streptomyces durmitorensis]UQT57063.1 hypothetical protein M4V62_19220 [Streptomyces durmitorensis]
MASTEPNSLLPASAHPMANPGYGKRLAPGQERDRSVDFEHLPKREASIAGFIDRLPEGAAMDHKTLATHIAGYGQAAVRSALKALSHAGHLRRIKEQVVRDDGARRWVTRTYWSRTPRTAAWWWEFCRSVRGVMLDDPYGGDGVDGDGGGEGGPPADEVPPPRSTAYRALAELGRTEPRLTLSAADCARLEPLAAAWLARGATVTHLTHALTAGLPEQLHNPAGIAKRRLEDKMPPEISESHGRETVLRRVMVCLFCETTGDEDPLVRRHGLCAACAAEEETDVPDTFRPAPGPTDVAAYADAVRLAAGISPRGLG